ncbi:MAG: chemotaxis protein CheA [Pseudomonadota bacterium]
MASPEQMAEMRASFFAECEELLEALQDGLAALSSGTDDGAIHTVFRAVHSIKGGAGAFGFGTLVAFAHGFETALEAARAGAHPDAELLKVYYSCSDHLSDLIRAARDGGTVPEARSDALLAALSPDTAPAPAASPRRQIRDFEITFVPDSELFTTGNEPFKLLQNLAMLGEAQIRCDISKVPPLEQLAAETSYLSWDVALTTDIDASEIVALFEFVEGLCRLTVQERGAPAPDPAQPAPVQASPDLQDAAAPSPRSIVRVDLERIERLVNLVGELVINQSMLAQSLETSGLSPHSDAMNGLEEFQRLTRDIQDSVMMIRAQPVKTLFHRMSRIVREASAAAFKDVTLITEGEETEVDKTVIERLADPLTHMIRNAIDHGLERPEGRAQAGKSPEGVVRLSAAHRSGRVIITISDDGAGIDRAKVQAKALAQGLITADAALSDAEIDALLFQPGFSTADAVSSLSGRGVGMDVVRASIQELGGRISIASTPGEGTTFTISLPLTLAVLDGMIVDVAGEPLVVPLGVIAETMTLDANNVDNVRPGQDVVRVRGSFVPLMDLGVALGYRAPLDTCVDRVVLLITGEDGTRLGLLVDDIQDQRQVVIKGLDDSFHRAPGIAAATILGDGQIALILDPTDLMPSAVQTRPLQEIAS